MAAESKTGCFLNLPKKSLSGTALPKREVFLLSALRIQTRKKMNKIYT